MGGCVPLAAEVQCDFNVILGGIATPRITLSAPNAGYAFRYVNTSQITIQVTSTLPLLPPSPATTGSYTGSVSAATGRGNFSFEVQFPPLSLFETVRIRIPYASDALLADVRSAWYITNGWDRFTYYGASQAASHDAAGTTCVPGGVVTNCLTVNGLPASTPANDKRVVLALMGPRAVPGKTWPGTVPADYLEYDNGSVDLIYEARAQGADYNDRLAVCPFTLTSAVENRTICN